MLLISLIPLFMVVILIIIPEYREFRLLQDIVSGLSRLTATPNPAPRYSFFTFNARRHLLRAAVKKLNLITEKEISIPWLHPFPVLSYPGYTRAYTILNRAVDELAAESTTISFTPKSAARVDSMFSNYPLLREIKMKLKSMVVETERVNG